MTTTTNKNKTLKKALNLNKNKNTKQVITKTENIEKCPQKSSENVVIDNVATEKEWKSIEWDVKDTIKDTILRLRNRFAYRSVISADEFKSALNEIENAIKQ